MLSHPDSVYLLNILHQSSDQHLVQFLFLKHSEAPQLIIQLSVLLLIFIPLPLLPPLLLCREERRGEHKMRGEERRDNENRGNKDREDKRIRGEERKQG